MAETHLIVWCIPIVIASEKQEIIIGKRAISNETLYPGHHEIVTGHVRPYETSNEAVYRELKEEIGAKRKDIKDIILIGESEQVAYGKKFKGGVFLVFLNKDFSPTPEKNHEQPFKMEFTSTKDFLERFSQSFSMPIKEPDVKVMLDHADIIDTAVRNTVSLLKLVRTETTDAVRMEVIQRPVALRKRSKSTA